MLVGRDDAGVVQLADAADESAAADENLALAAGIAGECVVHQVNHPAGIEVQTRLDIEVLAGLVPDAAREVDVLLLAVVPQLACGTEQERLLHAQSHVVDGGLLLIAHRPAHFLVGEALQRGLLDLHLENLAQVAALGGQGLELRRLHVELTGGTTHAHQVGTLRDGGNAVADTAHRGSVHGHHFHTVLVAVQDVEDEVLGALGGAIVLIARDATHENRVGSIKNLVIAGADGGDGSLTGVLGVGLGDILQQLCHRGLGVHAVEIDDHAAGMLAACIARNLVDGRGHGADFHDLLVNLVEQQVG